MQKQCQNCQKHFPIDADDVSFYEKIKVPPPTWCVQCRLQRRLSFRNERHLYHRNCAAPGHSESLVSTYSPNKALTIFDQKAWWGDDYDPMQYGHAYDFSRPFFEQFGRLIRAVPYPALINANSVNSDYCNFTTDNKNCYLVFGGDYNEDCAYSTFNFYSKDSQDLYFVDRCELCYELTDSARCYRVAYGRYLNDCTNSMFLYNCTGCSDCFGCVNLKNKSYCWFNEQLSKEEYKKRLDAFNIGKRSSIEKAKKDFAEHILKFPHKYAQIFRSVGSTGNNIAGAKNCINCFEVNEPAEDLKDAFLVGWGMKDANSVDHMGHKTELVYDSIAVCCGANNIRWSFFIFTGSDIMYSYNCFSCNNIFGCVGLRNKEYCIFNVQYSKEEYLALREKIIQQMKDMPYKDRAGRTYSYGEFFPAELSPYAYNETVASEYFPLKRDEVQSNGWEWQEPEQKGYQHTMTSQDLPDDINDVSEAILKEIILCAHEGTCDEGCSKAFRITQAEYNFYKRSGLPLPTFCPSCRHYQRFRSRPPIRLWPRSCMCTQSHAHHQGKCPNEFETSFAPERKEIVYCEPCYQAEVS